MKAAMRTFVVTKYINGSVVENYSKNLRLLNEMAGYKLIQVNSSNLVGCSSTNFVQNSTLDPCGITCRDSKG